jgi:small subunit ribosomal protein S15
MARMHSRRKGKSKSSKPVGKKQVWVRYESKEVQVLVQKLAKEGLTASEIGLNLRDSYGIPDTKKITKKSISKILIDSKLNPPLPQDLVDLIKRDISLEQHRENNKKDMTAKRGSILTVSKIKRLAKYYKKKGTLPIKWEYQRDQAKLLIN